MSKVKDIRRGHSKVSSKHQITIPVEALREAGLHVGDRLAARAVGPGQVLFELTADVLTEFSGSLTGVYAQDELKSLRDEWD